MAQCKALYDYDPQIDAEEMNLVEGQIVNVYFQEDPDWWICGDGDKNFGLVPSSYVEVVGQAAMADNDNALDNTAVDSTTASVRHIFFSYF